MTCPPDLLDASPALIVQSYVLADAGFAIRVRVQATVPGLTLEPGLDELAILDRYADQMDFCAITVKGPMNEGTRYEAERELDVSVGIELVRRGGARVAKTRHSVWLGDDGWVVDTFAGGNAPLMIAEVERGGPGHRPDDPRLLRHRGHPRPAVLQRRAGRHPYGAWSAAYEAELATRRTSVPEQPRAQPPRARDTRTD